MAWQAIFQIALAIGSSGILTQTAIIKYLLRRCAINWIQTTCYHARDVIILVILHVITKRSSLLHKIKHKANINCGLLFLCEKHCTYETWWVPQTTRIAFGNGSILQFYTRLLLAIKGRLSFPVPWMEYMIHFNIEIKSYSSPEICKWKLSESETVILLLQRRRIRRCLMSCSALVNCCKVLGRAEANWGGSIANARLWFCNID